MITSTKKGWNMRYSLIFVALLSISSLQAVETVNDMEVQNMGSTSGLQEIIDEPMIEPADQIDSLNGSTSPVLSQEQRSVTITVTGQGVAPLNSESPAQAYALAKRAAIADGYRLIAEKVKGVRVDGQDVIKNMMVKRSTVRTAVHAMVKSANVVATIFKEGLCEVEMEINLSYSDFAQ